MIAIARIGKKTGPRSERMIASNSASARIRGSAARKYTMLRRKACTMLGKSLRKKVPLKNDFLNSNQFGELIATTTITTSTTPVLTRAIVTPRTPSPWSGPRILERRLSSGTGSLGSPAPH